MKKNWIIGGAVALAGLLLLIFPHFCVKLIVSLLGLTAVIEGFYGIISERNLFENEIFRKTILYRSIGNIVIGLLAIVIPLALAGAAWAVMTYVLAVFLIGSAAVGFYASSVLKDVESDRKQLTIENIITLAAGILLFVIGPEKLGSVILRIIGLVVMLLGAAYILILVMDKKREVAVSEIEVKDDDSVPAESEK